MKSVSIPTIVVHGGTGSPMANVDGCQAAARAGMTELDKGSDALAAVVQAVVTMENDGRFNAGIGAVMRLDGAAIEMDASIMNSHGLLGAVACIQHARNPVLVARAIADSPHRLLCGEGAWRFAHLLGMASAPPTGKAVTRKREATIAHLVVQMSADADSESARMARLWNYSPEIAQASHESCDTVGAVARDAGGHFAVAGSTGGFTPSLLGRVGDTPIVGAGFYAGPAGAIAVTGIGEHILPHLLAHTVYRWIAEGSRLDKALRRGVDIFPPHIEIGLIGVSATESGHASNRPMPIASMSREVER